MDHVESSKQANLKSISLAGLLAGSLDSMNDLVSACKENGFFYLDFRHESTCDILKHVDDLAVIGKSVFQLPLEEKEQYSTEKYLPSRLFGYKRVGCSVGPFAGKKDGYESFSIHNNGIFGEDTIKAPGAIDENLPLFETFMSKVHEYTDCILSNLSKALELPYDLKDDMGTLTVVFSQSDGLQAMLPGDKQWSFIPPRRGHAVVNVGDSLRFLSKGVLASSLHRVVPPPDSYGQDKFSVIYFLRPEFDAKFTTHDGKEMNSVEWHNQKYALFREASLDAKQHGAMLTGRKEYLGSTDQ